MPEHGSPSPSAPTPASPPEQTAGNLRFLPIESLRTSYASLRPGSVSTGAEDIALLPIRVVPVPDGSFEIIDGFKRLEA